MKRPNTLKVGRFTLRFPTPETWTVSGMDADAERACEALGKASPEWISVRAVADMVRKGILLWHMPYPFTDAKLELGPTTWDHHRLIDPVTGNDVLLPGPARTTAKLTVRGRLPEEPNHVKWTADLERVTPPGKWFGACGIEPDLRAGVKASAS